MSVQRPSILRVAVLPGTQNESSFEERYEVLACLGEGGTGMVYKALQRSTGQPVALKTLSYNRNDPAGAEKMLRSLEREMALIAYLDSPHIVRLYDSGVTPNGYPFIALEFVSGATLREFLKVGPLEPALALRMTRHLLEALAEAHEQTIVHCDLKPENIIVSVRASRLRTRVLDFGISVLAEEELEGAIVGTPSYMAPERIEGRAKAIPAQDVYATGLILLEALTGRIAFEGKTADIVLKKQQTAPLVLPPWLANHPLAAILMKATEKNHEVRYANASKMLADLESIDPSTIPIQPGTLGIEKLAAIEEKLAAELAVKEAAKGAHRELEFFGAAKQGVPAPGGMALATQEIKERRKKLSPWILPLAVAVLLIVGALVVRHLTREPAEGVKVAAAESPKVEVVQAVVKEAPVKVVDEGVPLSEDELGVGELLGLARQAHREERLEDAIALYQEVVEKMPENQAALEELGWLYLKLDRFKEAVNVFMSAVEFDLNTESIVLGLALSQVGLGEDGAAQKSFQRYLELFPTGAKRDQVEEHLSAIEGRQGGDPTEVEGKKPKKKRRKSQDMRRIQVYE
ncbi:MAG: hypothetical protein AUK47_23925 [Deltaproteobacteria bacterium CG2_30_63_29]|nr:MAG: hypothetical protein AUK47_23925 [Deltaproteobacteria bacterium CG2_30_63_29]PJB35738.1 MAG: hypothetical protein CO108_24900 [Deltaproteobacteria bacterium CG_4_9_14_3_um_filter_63_12]